MIMAILGGIFAVVLCGIARRANARFRDRDRLPMQWRLNGEVTWSAPRAVALGFIPALALSVIVSLAVLSATIPPRPGQGDLVLPTFAGIGVMFVAIQLLHLKLVAATLRRNDR